MATLRMVCDRKSFSLRDKALSTTLWIIYRISVSIDTSDEANAQMLALIQSSTATRSVISCAGRLTCRPALEAVFAVSANNVALHTVNIKRYIRVEKIPSGEIRDSRVLSGDVLMFEGRRRCPNARPYVSCA